ncbi:MAG TPA: YncE family protein, partial [Sphingomicrobium sp.]|nr:YncE family protein [Sphingomicrobium sp.]
ARVQAFDTDTFDRLAEVKTGGVPIRVAASPDGKWIVTSNLGAGGLTIIDAQTRNHVREIALSGSEEAGQVTILFSPDGSKLYAAETGRDTIAEVDMASGAVLRRLPAGKNGDGLAIAGQKQRRD